QTTRGDLITQFLVGEQSAKAYMTSLARTADDYRGFNLLLMDEEGLYYFNNRLKLHQRLEPGTYALSNRYLDCNWPKVKSTRKALSQCVQSSAPLDLEALCDIMQAKGDGRPHSQPFITDDLYGTRATTAIIISADSNVHLLEKNYLESGKPGPVNAYSFPVVARQDRE
ncbi:MAG: NRDE family protein, partial [Gammaproteobacteria bacterium]